MTDTNKNNRPTHYIYQVIAAQADDQSEDSRKASWLRIGAAWMHKDGRGAQIVFNSIPLSGRIVMRERAEQADAEGGAQ